MTLAILDSFLFLPIAFLSPEVNSDNKIADLTWSAASHNSPRPRGHLSCDRGQFSFLVLLQYLSVGVVPRRNHRLSRLELLQTVPKPHQSRSSAAAAISREINAGILTCGRCSLGSLILCREKNSLSVSQPVRSSAPDAAPSSADRPVASVWEAATSAC